MKQIETLVFDYGAAFYDDYIAIYSDLLKE